jgi:hypothetical protein
MLEEAEKIIDYRSEDAGGTSADVAWGGGVMWKEEKWGANVKELGRKRKAKN